MCGNVHAGQIIQADSAVNAEAKDPGMMYSYVHSADIPHQPAIYRNSVRSAVSLPESRYAEEYSRREYVRIAGI